MRGKCRKIQESHGQWLLYLAKYASLLAAAAYMVSTTKEESINYSEDAFLHRNGS